MRRSTPGQILGCAASNRSSIDRRLCGSKPSLPVKFNHGAIRVTMDNKPPSDSDKANGLPARSIVGDVKLGFDNRRIVFRQ